MARENVKKVVLIQPPSSFLLEPMWTVPLTLCFFKTLLEDHGYHTEIVDLADGPSDPPWDIPLDADIYGISVYTPQHTVSKKIASFLKRNTKGITVCGGHHVTALKETYLKDSDFDVLAVGEGDQIILELCKGVPLHEIKGIVYSDNGHIDFTGYRDRMNDLGSIPLPRFDGVDLARYKGNHDAGGDGGLRVGIVTSRGCYHKCAFCSSYSFWKQKVKWHSSEKILRYIDYLHGMGVKSLEFLDDNFMLHPGFYEISNYLHTLNIAWTCMGRSDSITEKKALQLKESGCSWIALGVESGSDHVLKMMDKNASVSDHHRAINILHMAGVKVKAFMIAGFPGETDEDAASTERFIREEPVDLYGFCAFVPFPGTPIWHHPEQYEAGIDYSVPFEEYVLVSKDFAPRAILKGNERARGYLERYIRAAGEKCTNMKAFERGGKNWKQGPGLHRGGR